MQSIKIVVLVIVLTLLIIFAALASFLLINKSQGGVYFLSFKPGFSWKVDKDELNNYQQRLLTQNYQIKSFVIISTRLVKTSVKAGINGSEPAYYFATKKIYGWTIITIYINKDEWGKLQPEIRNKLLTSFVIRELNYSMGINTQQGLGVGKIILSL